MLFRELAVLFFLFFTFTVACPILERDPGCNRLEVREPRTHKVPKWHAGPHRATHKPAAPPAAPHRFTHSTNKNTPTYKPPTFPLPILYTGGGVVENSRKENTARTMCQHVTVCSCPKKAGAKISSTSCVNGICKCDDHGLNFFASKYLEAVKAFGNAGMTNAIRNIMQGLADLKEVVGTIMGSLLGPETTLKAGKMMVSWKNSVIL
ncbi:hypothetical protein GALMADRAFT_243604 [Galerina marginata CBS 339.88]|uniref:Extracellular membrane protein CFEM domain-containing protein n=1 Tax=Galerina marginata (strain CBS 339.88) TaxID=685588 RepID=A0A067T8J7_GALM3|nr:hypothetical protein GALMADRAFT_243604 [Galerina marginata CBS 339.88]